MNRAEVERKQLPQVHGFKRFLTTGQTSELGVKSNPTKQMKLGWNTPLTTDNWLLATAPYLIVRVMICEPVTT